MCPKPQPAINSTLERFIILESIALERFYSTKLSELVTGEMGSKYDAKCRENWN